MAAHFTPKLCPIFSKTPLETEIRKKKKKVKVLAGFWRLKVAGIGARGAEIFGTQLAKVAGCGGGKGKGEKALV